MYRVLFGRKCFYGWNKLIYELASRSLGIQNHEDIYASGETRFLNRYLSGRREFIVVDAGARLGEYSCYVRQRLPQAKIWALEPDPATFSILKEDADRHNYYAINKGLSNQLGSLPLYDIAESNQGTAYASLYKDAFEHIYKTPSRVQMVQMTTVDHLMKELSLSRIDLLKLDIEGHEYYALQGAKNALAEDRIDCIQFEFEEINALLKIFLRDFAEILPRFTFHRILPSGELLPLDLSSIASSEIFAFQNIVALRQKDKK